MDDLNCTFVKGRLTRNAELKYINGATVCNFAIACNYHKKDQDAVNFFDCVVFGNYAEALAPHLTKGKPVIIQAHLRQDRWTATTGESKSRISLICDNIELLPQSKKNEPAEPANAPDFNAEETEKIPF